MEKYYFSLMGSIKEQGYKENDGWLYLQKAEWIKKEDLDNGFIMCKGVKYPLIPFSEADKFIEEHAGIHIPENTTLDALEESDKDMINLLKFVEVFS